MLSIAELLQVPALRGVRVLAGDANSRFATSIRFVEDAQGLSTLPAESIAVLSKAVSADSQGYKLDINLRQAAGQGIAGLVLTGRSAPGPIAMTAAMLASRSGVVVLAAPEDLDVVELIVAAAAGIAGWADGELRRADEALTRLRTMEPQPVPGDTAEFLRVGSEALDLDLTVRAPEAGDVFARILLDGQEVSTISARMPHGHRGAASRIVVSAIAAAMERSLSAAVHGPGIPIRTRSAVLGDILVADDANSARLADQARRLGVSVDGWHRALMLHLVKPKEPPSFDFLQTIGEAALRAVRAGPHEDYSARASLATPGSQTPQSGASRWHLARWEDRIVLVEMWQRQPRLDVGRLGMAAGRDVLASMGAQFPQLRFRCGVGMAHQGVQGLRASVAEARVALGAPNRNNLVGYDAAGLKSMLLEWYGTDTARQAVRELLTPLEELGGERAETAITTLQAYLDEQGSLVRVAERLHLHRNAIVYRMQQIKKLLKVDLDDADQRLAVQLACRARLLR